MKNASDMLPNPDWSEFSGVVSGKSQTTGWVSISDLERFIYETRDDSNEFECEGDEAVAFGINQAMDGLTRLIESKKPNDMVTFTGEN